MKKSIRRKNNKNKTQIRSRKNRRQSKKIKGGNLCDIANQIYSDITGKGYDDALKQVDIFEKTNKKVK